MHKLNTRFAIFCLIGVGNTLVDIVVYLGLYNTTHSIFWANVVATSVALICSYVLNSKFTFQSKNWPRQRLLFFVIVTIFGLWVLQTYLIYSFTHLLQMIPVGGLHKLGSLEPAVIALAPKLLATGFTFIWNFIWYNKVIFRNAHKDVALEEVLAV